MVALERVQANFPGAGIASAILAFDALDAEQMARYSLMCIEAGEREDLQ
jgi:hypothetical protein